MIASRLLSLLLGCLRWLLLGTIALFMLAPTVIIAILSFSSDDFIAFPPRNWGWTQYETFFAGGRWMDALVFSALVAGSAALIATVAGVAGVLAFNRTGLPGRSALQALGIAPLLLPGIAYAVALYSLFAPIGLLTHPAGLVLAHATLVLPFAMLIVGAAITRIPLALELAAQSLGASLFQAWTGITIRLLAPAIGAALIFTFVTSFDEVVIASFLGFTTLPIAIFSSVRFGVDPVITAIATLLTLATAILMGLRMVMGRQR